MKRSSKNFSSSLHVLVLESMCFGTDPTGSRQCFAESSAKDRGVADAEFKATKE